MSSSTSEINEHPIKKLVQFLMLSLYYACVPLLQEKQHNRETRASSGTCCNFVAFPSALLLLSHEKKREKRPNNKNRSRKAEAFPASTIQSLNY